MSIIFIIATCIVLNSTVRGAAAAAAAVVAEAEGGGEGIYV